MNSEFEVLRDVVTRLESAGIPYMLTGSVAMSIYAEPRMTRDIDIVVELAPGDAHRVSELFSTDYYVSEEAVRAAILERRMFNLFNLSRLVKVDLIKLAWAAPSESAFQLRDVRKLLASGADEAYLHHWSVRLGVDVLLRRCMDAGHDS